MRGIIDFFGVLKLFFWKYLPAAMKESRDELMREFGRFLMILAGMMLFFFCILGLMMNPIAFYVYVAIMASLAFIGIILKAMFSETERTENNE